MSDFKETKSPQARIMQQVREVKEWEVFTLRFAKSVLEILTIPEPVHRTVLWEGNVLVRAIKSVYGR